MTEPDCEAAINQILAEAGLRSHPLFAPRPRAGPLDVAAAWQVARAWGEVTRAFMFTTIASLGTLATELDAQPAPPVSALTALQTGFTVIGDDLTNRDPIFGQTAPAGVAWGVDYRWWDDTITAPLARALPAPPDPEAALPPGVQALLDNMRRLGRSPIGAAVQLRVVEDIALDIATAFRALFGQVSTEGTPVFADPDLAWIDAHIEAEVVHRATVSDHETGMATIAATPAGEHELLAATTEYATNWARALDDLAAVPAHP